MLDRSIGPEIKKITELNVPDIKQLKLDNGCNVYEVNLGTQDLTQIEVILPGGRIAEHKKGVSRATARLLKEGSIHRSGKEIAEQIDFLGANIATGANLDFTYLKIHSLTRHVMEVLRIVEEIFFHPIFPKEELEKYKKNAIERLKMEKAKPELICYKAITETIFGSNHVYGYNSTEAIYKSLNQEDLVIYHKANFTGGNCKVIISGKVTTEIREAVVDLFGSGEHGPNTYQYNASELVPNYQSKTIEANDKVQAAIKIGRRLFNRHHPDFADLFIMNTILGGYFGSRLMTSIREEKGYTYNIYSSLDMMIHDGYFNISTEVGNEYVKPTIKAIYDEIERLQKELVSEQELQMVKNYLSGNFLNMVDGPFKVAGIAKLIATNDLPMDFFERLMDRVHSITSKDILIVAQKYLNRDAMTEVIVVNPDI